MAVPKEVGFDKPSRKKDSRPLKERLRKPLNASTKPGTGQKKRKK